MRDVHNYQQVLDSSLKRVENLSVNNQKAIKEFVKNCELEEISTGRIAKYVIQLMNIAKWLDKDFDKADMKDIENLVLQLRKHDYTEWTMKDYKVAIKKFYRFLKKEELISWIKTTMKKNKNDNLPNEVYTQEEVEKLIETEDNPKDKCLISLLYESGCRISELLNIKIKDINFEQDYALINVMGKTGNRTIPISKSVALLKTWLNYHEDKGNKEAYLFDYQYFVVLHKLKMLFIKAKIDKPFNPHQFRHSRATELAQNLTEAQMKQFFGWTQSSNMASVYVHLTGRDLIPKLITENKTRKCYKCGFENPVDLKFCSSCLMLLDSKEYKEKSKHEITMKGMYRLATQDKEWLDFTAKRLEKIMK